MNEVFISVIHEDDEYMSDRKICSDKELKKYIDEVKDIMSNEEHSYIYFKAEQNTHFFSRGVIENSIITISVRKIEDDDEDV